MKLSLTAIFLTLVLLLCWGCGGGSDELPLSRLNGVWTIDVEKTIASNEKLKAQLAADPAAMEQFKAIDFSITIDPANSLLCSKLNDEEIRKFTVLWEEDNMIKIKEATTGYEYEIKITVIDANTISLSDNDGRMKGVLVRSQ